MNLNNRLIFIVYLNRMGSNKCVLPREYSLFLVSKYDHFLSVLAAMAVPVAGGFMI